MERGGSAVCDEVSIVFSICIYICALLCIAGTERLAEAQRMGGHCHLLLVQRERNRGAVFSAIYIY